MANLSSRGLLSLVVVMAMAATRTTTVQVVGITTAAFSFATVPLRPPGPAVCCAAGLVAKRLRLCVPPSEARHRHRRRRRPIPFEPRGVPASLLAVPPHSGDGDGDDSRKSYASISSDGTITGGARGGGGGGTNNPARPTGSLGRPKKRNTRNGVGRGDAGAADTLTTGMSKVDRQRTATGTMNSSNSKSGNDNGRAAAAVQVVRGKRGSKTVTLVRGMSGTPIEERKALLKLLKGTLGVGGTLADDGALELQGTHTDRVVELLRGLGYPGAQRVGS